MNIIVIAHNQYDLLIRWMESAEKSGISMDNTVFVDNYSDDGLSEALKETALNYIVCDEKEEAYSVICNTVIREFNFTGKVYVTSPEYMLNDKLLSLLEQEMDEAGDMAAISPAIYNSSELYYNAVNGVEADVDSFVSFNCTPMCVMYNMAVFDELDGFDEKLFLPDSSIKDYIFRALLLGHHCAESNRAMVLSYGADRMHQPLEALKNDRTVLKRKWNMNYFNTIPNGNLIVMMNGDRNAEINVLEIGCDCGANLLEIKRYYKNANLYGVEINEDAARLASQLINVKNGNIEEQSIDFGVRFDYIIFGDVLEHLHAPDKAVRYCKKMLKNGGRIIASIPNLGCYEVIRELLKGNFQYSDTGLLDRTHIHFFAFNEILRLFINEGYSVENVRTIGTELTDADREFIDNLMKISPETQEHMLTTYQYVVSAVYNGE